MSGHPSAAGRVQDRESPLAKDRRSTTEPTPPTYSYNDEMAANLVDTVVGTDGVGIDAGDGEWSNGQVAIVFFVSVTSGNKPTWTICIHTHRLYADSSRCRQNRLLYLPHLT